MGNSLKVLDIDVVCTICAEKIEQCMSYAYDGRVVHPWRVCRVCLKAALEKMRGIIDEKDGRNVQMNEYEKNDDEQSQLGQEAGAKFDSGKSRWDLMPGDVLLEIADNTRTIIGLHEMETKIKDFANKTLFHYSNGMEAAWSFWVGKDKVPIEAGSQIPLVFASISYIHLLDLCLISEDEASFEPREERFKYEIPNCGGFYLLSYRVLNYLGDIYLYGCKKYDENNWRKGMEWGKIFAAFCRHSGQWLDGQTYDQESGLHHIGHALWQLLGLRWYQQNKTDLDDRWINE